MATFYQTERNETYHIHEYTEAVEKEGSKFFSKFRHLLNSYTFFHASFFLLALIEVSIFAFSAINYSESATFIITLASMILTLFSYFILHYYLQGKKVEQFKELRFNYLQSCKKQISVALSEEEIHLAIAKTTFELAASLCQNRIYTLSLPPFEFFKEFLLKSRFLFHFKDVIMMQELLIELSLDEYMNVLKLEPTDLAIHTSLANLYMTLSNIYKESKELSSFISKKVFKRLGLPEKIENATKSAIEELKILDDLAPNDPWTHAQLANCYHLLNRFDDELLEYEILYNLRSKDQEILLRLGILYFKLGKTAKGLITYEALKKLDAKYADHLISHYHCLKLTS